MASDGTKLAKIKSGTQQAVSMFISKNIDLLGDIYVYDVLVSADCRTARVFIRCQNSSIIKIMISHKGKIYEEMKSCFSSKYLPVLEFIPLRDEIALI